MRIYLVESSNLAAIAYEPSLKRLRVYFHKDREVTGIYDYDGVSAAMVGEMMFSESVGAFFGRHIRTTFTAKQLEGEAIDSAMNLYEKAAA